jgi:hypothetical protein
LSDEQEVRALAARKGYRLVKGRGRVVGRRDYGRYGLERASTGYKAFGFGNRGVRARLEEVARFLDAGGEDPFDATLKGSGKRK